MTVSTSDNRWSYAGDGSQTIFQYLARIYVASDLKVYLRDVFGEELLQTLGSDYTLDGILDDDGGNVTFVTAPADGKTVIIKIELPFTQELSLPEAGLLPTGPLEIALDRLLKLSLSLKEQLTRALKFSEGSPSQDKVFPEPEAGKYLVWGSDGALANTLLLNLTDAVTIIAVVTAAVEAYFTAYFSNPSNFPGGQDAAKIANGSVSNAEFQYLDGVTSAIQGQLNAKAANAKGAKVWCMVTYISGTPSIRVSYNVTSITDVGTGEIKYTFTIPFSTTEYVTVVSNVSKVSSGAISPCPSLDEAGSVNLKMWYGTTLTDPYDYCRLGMACFGDQ